MFREESLFPELPSKDDDLFKFLFSNFEPDRSMVKPLLEMIFSSFVSLSKRMLFDHLEGALSNPSDSLLHESKFVPSKNAAAE